MKCFTFPLSVPMNRAHIKEKYNTLFKFEAHIGVEFHG